jgi:hypothetical protein
MMALIMAAVSGLWAEPAIARTANGGTSAASGGIQSTKMSETLTST